MATITTTTNANFFRYPGQEKFYRDNVTGHLWSQVVNSSGTLELWRSTNGGSSWGLRTSRARSNVQEYGNLFVHNNWAHIAFRTNESNNDIIYHCRYNITGDWWDSELAYISQTNGGVAGATLQGCHITVVRYSSWDWVVMAAGYTTGTSGGIFMASGTINIGNNVELLDNSKLSKRLWYAPNQSGGIRPAIVMPNHTTKHLWATFGRTKLWSMKGIWNGNGWTMPGSATPIQANAFVAQDSLAARWDGSRFIMAVPNSDATALDTVTVFERNDANTTTTKRVTEAHPTGAIRNCTVAADTGSGDLRVYAIGTSNQVLYYCSYDRSSDTWTSWAQVVATAVLGAAGDSYGVRALTAETSKYDVYVAHSGAPNTAVHYQQSLAFPPNTPTWNGATGTSGEARNVSASLLLDWDFSDIDPTDSQSAYAVQRQIGAGALNYWRASDSTWQSTEQKNTSGTTALTLSTGWGSGSDAATTFKAKVWDETDVASAYSAGFTVIPSVVVNPSLTLPTVDQVIGTPNLTVTWTASEQTKFKIKLSPNPNPDSVTFYDSGWVVSTALSYIVPFVLDNKSAYTVTLQTANNEGLASVVQTRNFTSDFVAPGTPTVVLTPLPASGVMRVALTNPVAGIVTFVGTGAADSGSSGSRTPALPAGLQHDDAMFCYASTRNSGTGAPDVPTDWTSIIQYSNIRLLGKLYRAGDTAPVVPFIGGAANEDTIAQVVAFRGASLMRSGSAQVLNGSTQNVAYPSLTIILNAQLVFVLGWKQDDWTSVATLAGMTEIGEPSSTAGNDAAQVWDYVIQTTAANITGSSFTVTGGAAAISRGLTVTVSPKANVASQDLYRRKVGELDDGVRVAAGLASGATYDDFLAISGINYEYRARVTSDTGSEAWGDWTS